MRAERHNSTPLRKDWIQLRLTLLLVGDPPPSAGLQHVSRLEDFPSERWSLLIQVMLTGVADLTRAVLPVMRAQGFGRIINIGSIHSIVGSVGKSAYVAAKHGLIGFGKVLALETSDTDITINTICPSYVKTPLVDAQIAAQAKVTLVGGGGGG